MNLMVTTNQKPTTDTQNLERKEHNYNTKGNRLKEGKNREELQKQPENK